MAALLLPLSVSGAALTITLSGSGYVSSSYPYWITCENTCTHDIADGSEITLSATPYGTSDFVGWNGACSGTQSTCVVKMDAVKDVTATFSGQVVKEYQLTVSRTGRGKGTIVSEPSGIFVGSTFNYDYTNFAEGTLVTLTATPLSNATVQWSGDCSSTEGNTCTLTINAEKQVTAEFVSTDTKNYTLSVKKTGKGSGTVTSEKNLNCGEVCSELIPEGETVTLHATPDVNSQFDGFSWPCSTAAACEVLVDKDTEVTATFSVKDSKDLQQNESVTLVCGGLDEQICDVLTCVEDSTCMNGCKSPYVQSGDKCAACSQGTTYSQGKCFLLSDLSDNNYYNLLVNKTGPGIVTAPFYKIYCGQYCSAMYRQGSTADLEVYPDEGATFSGWEGDCTGTGNQCSLVMNNEKKVTAIFKGPPPWYTLSVNVSGQGKVTSSNNANIDCGQNCSSEYVEGTVVELSATPEQDKKLKEWQGACIHNESICLVTMDAPKNVNVIFVDIGQRKLQLFFEGNGTVYFPGGPRGADLTEEFVNNKLKSGKFPRFCRKDCKGEWSVDSRLRLVPEPAEGFEFEGWGGACSGNGHCILPMNVHRQVTAKFKKLPPKHDITISVTGNGVIKSGDAMIDCRNVCTVTSTEGMPLTLTAYPDPDLAFASWGGDCFGKESGKEKSCTLTIDSPKSVTAEFRQQNYTLSLTVVGRGRVKSMDFSRGEEKPFDAKIDCGEACNYTYPKGTKIGLGVEYGNTVTHFLWQGDCNAKSTFCTLIMDSDKKVTGKFRSSRNNLTIINKGNGHVAAATYPYPYPFTFSCDGTNCTATNVYAPEQVLLRLFPEKDTTIYGVEWECKSTALECWIMMDDDKTVIINSLLNSTFQSQTYVLKVSKEGEGSIKGDKIQGFSSIDCGTACEATLPVWKSYHLDPIPSKGWTFTGWEGGEGFCREQLVGQWKVGSCDILPESTLTGPDKSVAIKAKFGKSFKVKVEKGGAKKGTVRSSPSGIDCGTECREASQTFPGAVTLTATPETGAIFTGWGWACSGNGQCKLNGDSDKKVTASFDECLYSTDCAWNQYCDLNSKCVDIPCKCGEIQNHDCVKYECCSESDCKLYQRCNTQQNKCVELNQCLIYSSEGWYTDKLDLVIIGDGFADNRELEKEIIKVIESKETSISLPSSANDLSVPGSDGLFDIAPFKENKHKFNIWMRNVPGLKHQADGKPDHDDAITWAKTCPRDVVAVFSKGSYRSYAFLPSTPPWGGTAFVSLGSNSIDNGKLLAHELGHAIGGLADEYTEEGRGSYPNLVNCAAHYTIAKVLWGDLEGKDGVGYFTDADDILTSPFVKRNPEGGCSYMKTNVRPTLNSLMRDHTQTNSFGPVNERELRKKLGEYK